jgi:hypothetical protein
MPSRSQARARLARELGGLNVDDPISLIEAPVGRTRGDYGATIPAEIADAIDNAYRSLGTDVAVAVRSLGTTAPRMQVTAHSPD